MTIILTMIVFNISMVQINRFHSEKRYEAIMEQKMIYIKESVNNQIIRIEGYQDNFNNNIYNISNLHAEKWLTNHSSETDLKSDIDHLNEIIPDAFTIILFHEGNSLYNPNNMAIDLALIEEDNRFASYEIYAYDNYQIFIGINKSYIDQRVFDQVKSDIMDQQYERHTYMWINQILNYNGGDDYAVRFIHPNSNPPSGTMLSTHTEIYGLTPYLTELEGINNEGEVYFRYFFQLPETEELKEKITFAKLYEPYDWVIAMGIYIEDVSYYVEQTNRETNLLTLEISFVFFGIFIIALGANYLWVSYANRKEFINMTNSTYEQANVDELTKAYLRRVAIKHYDQYVLEVKNKNNDMYGFILFDIDYFKQINDTYGHKMGDLILKELIGYIKKNTMIEQRVYRWGGDEFILIMKDTSLENIMRSTENLKNEIPHLLFKLNQESLTKITLSIGLTLIKPDDNGIDDAVSRADKALYQAKKNGKNRIEYYIEP